MMTKRNFLEMEAKLLKWLNERSLDGNVAKVGCLLHALCRRLYILQILEENCCEADDNNDNDDDPR